MIELFYGLNKAIEWFIYVSIYIEVIQFWQRRNNCLRRKCIQFSHTKGVKNIQIGCNRRMTHTKQNWLDVSLRNSHKSRFQISVSIKTHAMQIIYQTICLKMTDERLTSKTKRQNAKQTNIVVCHFEFIFGNKLKILAYKSHCTCFDGFHMILFVRLKVKPKIPVKLYLLFHFQYCLYTIWYLYNIWSRDYSRGKKIFQFCISLQKN